ncbi:LSU ribosomal protein L23p [[Mycoplasma] cavipharyngis]|uniref:uL23 family ribosomal protein n=1 Tax=[Mycoplasma] cavipharyngis TaxID=92757 RepID=UPI0037049775
MDLTNIILRPINTEKSYLIRNKNNQYAFSVATKATKSQIRAAFKAIFSVDPIAVNTILRKPQPTRFMAKNRQGKTKLIKIAYISVAKEIKLFEDQTDSQTVNDLNDNNQLKTTEVSEVDPKNEAQ